MAEEIQEAIQIIRVAYDGVEICMKAGSSGLKALQQIVQLFKYLLDQEKLSGKTSMKKLLMRGGDLQVLKFPEQDLKRIEKAAKKYCRISMQRMDMQRFCSIRKQSHGSIC